MRFLQGTSKSLHKYQKLLSKEVDATS